MFWKKYVQAQVFVHIWGHFRHGIFPAVIHIQCVAGCCSRFSGTVVNIVFSVHYFHPLRIQKSHTWKRVYHIQYRYPQIRSSDNARTKYWYSFSVRNRIVKVFFACDPCNTNAVTVDIWCFLERRRLSIQDRTVNAELIALACPALLCWWKMTLFPHRSTCRIRFLIRPLLNIRRHPKRQEFLYCLVEIQAYPPESYIDFALQYLYLVYLLVKRRPFNPACIHSIPFGIAGRRPYAVKRKTAISLYPLLIFIIVHNIYSARRKSFRWHIIVCVLGRFWYF